MPCYSGPNPVDKNDPTGRRRTAIWRWAKANGVDHGLPIDKVGDAINQQFFAGQAKPEWITDILSGRKTPLREVANAAWKAQYNRRVITQQAKDLYRAQTMGPITKALRPLLTVPRWISVGGGIHGVVFPFTHGGDLLLRPASWGTFFKGVLNTWKSLSPAASERLLDSMRRQDLFETALRSGLDVGKNSHPVGMGGGGISARTWDALTVMRYELWNNAMQKHTKPTMSEAEILDIGKNLAEWANHATGSGKGVISSSKLAPALFGPKITQSKLNRLFVDPVKTVQTFAKMARNPDSVTAGEKAVAWQRLSGSMQYVGSLLGFLAANQGLLMATGQKQNINFGDPTKGDWLKFKAGGFEFGIPGMHTELKTLGQILNLPRMSKQELHGKGRREELAKIFGQYWISKATPAAQIAAETGLGMAFPDRPVPWSPEPGKPGKPGSPYTKERYGWAEYAWTHAPIPLTGPVAYVYQQLRASGAKVPDAAMMMRALMMFGVGVTTGLHVGGDYPKDTAKTPLRTRNARSQISH